jgi:NADH:ubiquinone oxidoreductase subunit 6 (subunit J)
MGLAITFWILAVVVIVAALGVVTLRNVFRAALSLVLCFAAVAGIYITLSADFLAAVQVLIYVGAISVLLILGIMMTRDIQRGSPSNRMRVPALIVSVLFMGIMIYSSVSTAWPVSGKPPLAPTTAPLADKLFGASGFILPVEIAALLLLVAVVGSIVIAREK